MSAPVSPLPAPVASPGAGALARRFTLGRLREQLIQTGLLLCALVSILTTIGIIVALVSESVVSLERAVPAWFSRMDRNGDGDVSRNEFSGGPAQFEQWDADADGLIGRSESLDRAFFQEVSPVEFLTGSEWAPTFNPPHFGVLPLLCGTFLVAGIAALIGMPVGILSSVYLSEYSSPRVRSIIKPVLELLAGVPSVVYGYFALMFITPYVLKPVLQEGLGFEVGVFNALSAGIVVGIMILPMVCSLSEDALRAVPRSLREAGYALGSTKFDVSTKIVLPAAISGIVASFILAISRAVGETMAVTMAAGNSPNLTLNPLRGVQTMTSFIASISMGETPTGSIEYKSLYAVGLSLFCITLVMNIVSQRVMRRYREVYQ